MRSWLSEKLGELRLVLDLPARMSAIEQENAELLSRTMELEREVEALERELAELRAVTRELYLGKERQRA